LSEPLFSRPPTPPTPGTEVHGATPGSSACQRRRSTCPTGRSPVPVAANRAPPIPTLFRPFLIKPTVAARPLHLKTPEQGTSAPHAHQLSSTHSLRLAPPTNASTHHGRRRRRRRPRSMYPDAADPAAGARGVGRRAVRRGVVLGEPRVRGVQRPAPPGRVRALDLRPRVRGPLRRVRRGARRARRVGGVGAQPVGRRHGGRAGARRGALLLRRGRWHVVGRPDVQHIRVRARGARAHRVPGFRPRRRARRRRPRQGLREARPRRRRLRWGRAEPGVAGRRRRLQRRRPRAARHGGRQPRRQDQAGPAQGDHRRRRSRQRHQEAQCECSARSRSQSHRWAAANQTTRLLFLFCNCNNIRSCFLARRRRRRGIL